MKKERGEVTLVMSIGILIYSLVFSGFLIHAEKKAEQCEQKAEQALVIDIEQAELIGN